MRSKNTCSICGSCDHDKRTHGIPDRYKRCWVCKRVLLREEFPTERTHACRGCERERYRERDKRLATASMEGCLRAILKGTRCRAKKQGLVCSISVEDLIDIFDKQNGMCYYTGHTLKVSNGDRNRSTSLERIDSNLGYTKENTVLALWMANQAKNTLTEQQFIQLCQDVVAHHLKKSQDPLISVE